MIRSPIWLGSIFAPAAVKICRRGSAAAPLLVVVGLAALGGLLWAGWSLSRSDPAMPNSEPLIVYCAASNRSVVEAVCRDYEQTYGTKCELQYGPSQTLLASAEVSGKGDLYLPADDSFLDIAHKKQLIAERFPLATMQAVVAVPKGNPKEIAKFDDLLRPDVRVAQAGFEAAAIGKLTKEVLTKSGRWEELHARTAVYKTTVNEAANDVKVGAADAAIVFDAVLHDYDTLEAVVLPELQPVEAHVAAAVLKSSKQPTRALHFARFLSAADKGLVRYREFGFAPVEGDQWADKPEIVLYAGSMLRPAIEQTVNDFEKREGVSVMRVYNGCGTLVTQMRAGEVPDAYFACDVEFMKQVQDLFPGSEDISQNELVILVQKGNPHNLASLADLAKPGLRVGIGHEKQCAMGWITQRTFREGGVQSVVMKNVVTEVPSGDMLVNQMQTGSLDAAVAYLSNAAGAAEYLDAIRIEGLPCSIAVQPYATRKDSKHKQLTARLLAAIRDETSRQRFVDEGFQWLDAKATQP